MSPSMSMRGACRTWAALLLTLSASTAGAACPSWNGVPVVSPVIPCDSRGTNQTAFNNLAWQQFIALNWAADPNQPGQPNTSVPAAAFGAPGTTPVAWETYKESSEVFRPNGKAPLPWGASQAMPARMLAAARGHGKLAAPKGIKPLFMASKLTEADSSALHDIAEAGTNGAWLTAQPKMNNYLTLFEKRLNRDEYNFITQNQLYIANKQVSFAMTQGINMPDGSATFSSYGTVGAIEIKAAWIQLDDPSLWPLFKTSTAMVSYPLAGGGMTPPKQVTVGLVALHIIRKTPNAQQFMWSTFEHKYNAPSRTELSNPSLPWYTYYNLNCNPTTDYYQCKQNQPPKSCNGEGATCTPDPYTAPVQVVRNTPISSTTTNDIAGLNKSVWATISAANPDSVFLNYQLVNVLWPNNNTPIGAGATVPLTNGDAQPPVNQQPVANVVLETYHQNLNCLSCHASAPIAGPKATLASDYSFLYDAATNPSTLSRMFAAQGKSK